MTLADIDDAADTFDEAFATFQALPDAPNRDRPQADIDRARQRVAHLLGTDPAGSWVAEAEGVIVGMTQAHVRDAMWVLALLAVRPAQQDRGLGQVLLERALEYSIGSSSRAIFSSQDPRALRRYVNAGFDLEPAVRISGAPRPGAVSESPKIVQGSATDLATVNAVDQQVRGAQRPRDLELLLSSGFGLLLHPDGGYALVDGARIGVVAAVSEVIAVELLETAIAQCPAESELQIGWVTAHQQWAIATGVKAGLAIRPSGPIMSTHWRPLAKPYLPNGLFG